MKGIGKKGQSVLSPAMIMGIVVSLIILAVGVYAFFTTQNMIPKDSNAGFNEINNSTATANQVFNVVGIVLVIGAILLIVQMVYGYMRP
jgi:beta-lactamase regulating signal transducer with metallopeptidase domain